MRIINTNVRTHLYTKQSVEASFNFGVVNFSMSNRITKSLFQTESTMSDGDFTSPSQLEWLKFTTPLSSRRGGELSSRSRHLRSASIGGCTNCKELEQQLQAERTACRKAAINASKAHEKCVDLGATLNKMANILYKATEKLRSLEENIEAVIESTPTKGKNTLEIIIIDWSSLSGWRTESSLFYIYYVLLWHMQVY